MQIKLSEAKEAFLEADLINQNNFYAVQIELKTNLHGTDEELEWGLYGTPKDSLGETVWGKGNTFETALKDYRNKAEKIIAKASVGKFVEA